MWTMKTHFYFIYLTVCGMYELPTISRESRGPLQTAVHIVPTSLPTYLAVGFTSTLTLILKSS